MYDITSIILAVLALLSALVTGFLVPWLREKTGLEQRARFDALVKVAVTAAEQIFAGAGRGEEKKKYAINWLNERGITFDEATVDAAIEAAVYQLTHGTT